ncbi:hypothetical protein SCB49_11362 [unidentified eubacterium SCB49]|nr:hypothetical protein SCB49_11362 [unidentified eubacterium SCB49]
MLKKSYFHQQEKGKQYFYKKFLLMKYVLTLFMFALLIASCDANKTISKSRDINTGIKNDTIRIANDELEYEIIIIEPGFNSFLLTQPPRGHYGITFLENKNRMFVTEYNSRVNNPQQFDYTLYPQTIDYQFETSYGYEVNYMLYNYFNFFMQRYNQKFTGSRF